MASTVFQQIITDSVTAIPGGSGSTEIKRDDQNTGIFVKISNQAGQTAKRRDRNAGFASPVVEKVSTPGQIGTGDPLFGILCDYHSERRCTIARKGRIAVASAIPYSEAYLRWKVALQDATTLPGISNITFVVPNTTPIDSRSFGASEILNVSDWPPGKAEILDSNGNVSEIISYASAATYSIGGVTRGIDGTTARAHPPGTTVRRIIPLSQQTSSNTIPDPSATPKPTPVPRYGVGEIIGGGVHEEIGNYFLVDLNLPDKGPFSRATTTNPVTIAVTLSAAINATTTTINVRSDVPLPTKGTLTVGTEQIDVEIFRTTPGSDIISLSGSRGSNSTTAAAHALNAAGTIVARA